MNFIWLAESGYAIDPLIKKILEYIFHVKKDKTDKQTPTVSGLWATNLPIDSSNVFVITKASGAKWEIENQHFHTLKNLGYELMHN